MNRVSINADIFHWVSDRSGLPIGVLEKKFPKVRNWIKGESQPTLKQVENLAKKTNTPLGYFFLPTPIQERLPIPHFRTMSDEPIRPPSPELLDTVYAMQQRQEWMREYLIDQGQQPLSFVNSAKIMDDYKVVANDIKSALELKDGWATQYRTWGDALKNLYLSIEEIGILVVANGIIANNTHRKLNVKEFRGFTLYDNFAPLIFVNSADSKAAQMFTLAHEIAHIWFGSSAAFDLRNLQPSKNVTEQACNAVAAEFLVPENNLRRVWEDCKKSTEPYQAIARRFKISPIVGARRALDINLITRDDFFAFYEEYINDDRRRNKKKKNRGDFWANQNYRIGRRFGNAVISAVKEGKLLYNYAYKLTGLSGNTFNEFAERSIGELYGK